jgi:hypothetical protein
VSNQSLNGVIHRWDPQEPASLAWVALVLITLGVVGMAVRGRRRASATRPPASR